MDTASAVIAATTVKPFGPPAPRRHRSVDLDTLEAALGQAAGQLLRLQKPDGHWCGELEGDTILESEYVLLEAFLGRIGQPRIRQCCRYIQSKQDAGGGWSNHPGGPPDLSITVKAYFALKLGGMSPQNDCLRRARTLILELGGAEGVNSFTRFYLAALGQIPYALCPSVPPELVLLPPWLPINLYTMSAWTRAIVVPLSICSALQPVTRIPPARGIEELFREPAHRLRFRAHDRFEGRTLTWPNFFRMLDRLLKAYGPLAPPALRAHAIRKAERWMIDHFEDSDGLGAIFPPMVYSIMALRSLGYAEDSAEVRWAQRQLDALIIEEGDTIRLQPCFSPVWDTAWAMLALAEAGHGPSDPVLVRAADWLLEREIKRPGDCSLCNPQVTPAGWAFEYRNDFYPDIDDTAAVLLALRRTNRFHGSGEGAVDRGLAFLRAMQGRDGGWAAFDKDVDNPILEAVPFADHNAILDPACPDVTARILELLGRLGHRRGEAMVDAAVRFLWDQQEPEGPWTGRWGVNYVYGTWQVLVGLAAIGFDMAHPRVRRAVRWLESVQQSNGGWGESCQSYVDRSRMGRGPTTPSQTAWAVLGLIAAGPEGSTAVQRGIRYLLGTQQADGTWDEPYFTGTGFPKVFYLRYHYYRLYFPLLALARYRATFEPAGRRHVATRSS